MNMTRTSYWRSITLQELTNLWGFTPIIKKEYKNSEIYLRVTKNNQPYMVGGGSFAHGAELICMSNISIIGTEKLF